MPRKTGQVKLSHRQVDVLRMLADGGVLVREARSSTVLQNGSATPQPRFGARSVTALVKQGLLSFHVELQPNRMVYRITPAGLDAVRRLPQPNSEEALRDVCYSA